jgi:nicotinate-nucleotide--dimethylbenzimidazole phosphoribosyltransferase
LGFVSRGCGKFRAELFVTGDLGENVREALHLVIQKRRDIRLFRAGLPIPDEVLRRILDAAHHAPSVGYSQPWDFIVVRDLDRRARIRENFLQCRAAEAARYPSPRREQYLAYRLEGIVDSSLNLCVTVDLRPTDEQTLGTIAQPEALRWSACCAVQNLWLAARAEGVGVGWVSIVEPSVLRKELNLPAGIEPVAYLCVGYPVEFRDRPMLEESGWRGRRALDDVIHEEVFPAPPLAPKKIAEFTSSAPGADLAAREAALAHQARLCKPTGSLGRLEELGVWFAGARGQFPVEEPRARLYVVAADHGVVAEGVSAYSSSVTAAMVGNFLAGGAAVSSLAKSCNVEVMVVDAGVAGDMTSLPREGERRAPLIRAAIRAGTGNLRREPAMSLDDANAALALGARLAKEAADAGMTLLCAGDMGIGNTTSAAALLCALAGVSPEDAVGRGTGVDETARARKIEVVKDALLRHTPGAPLELLARLGGLELATLAGLCLGAAKCRIPVVIDGFPAAAAALAAFRLDPKVKDHLLLSHRSAERGALAMQSALGLEPIFDLGMRLGEGTGAVLATHLVGCAVRLMNEMATFSTAGIPGRGPRIE